MPESAYSQILIQNHEFQESKNDCGPFCAAIVLNALSTNTISGSALSNHFNRITWKGIFPHIYRIPNWATFPWGIASWLRNSGINARWKTQVTTEYLKSKLNDTIFIVTIGSLWPLWAHYKILVAIDANLGWGFVDPATPSSSTSWQANRSFVSQWSRFGHMVIEIKPGPEQVKE